VKLEEGRKRDTAANALLALSFATSASQSPKDLIRSGHIEGPGVQLMSRMMSNRKKATSSGLDNPRISAKIRTFKEFLELCESSGGERMSRGSTGNRTGRALNQMTRKERSVAAIARKAELKGTGKLSTKDLRKPSRLYTNNNPDGYGDKGSTKVSHYITTHASPRSAAISPDLEIINKREYVGLDNDGKIKFKHHSSADSVRRAKDFRNAIVRSGGNERGKVHDVSIMADDAFREKNQTKGRMTLGRNLVKGVKDYPKHLKAAGAKSGEIVTGKASSVFPGEDKKTGAEARGKLYGRILRSRASKRSEKTGVMLGKAG